MKKNKGQEEMVGFAVIIVIVAVLILIFLSFALREDNKDNVESFEAESFLQAILQYTTECENSQTYLSIQKLISACNEELVCGNNKESCDVLNETLKGLVSETWKVGENRPVAGYSLIVIINGEDLISIKEGNVTKNSRSSKQDFISAGEDIEISFEAYFKA